MGLLFRRAPADDVLLVLAGSELGLDCRMLARMLDSHLSAAAVLTVRPHGGSAPARLQVKILAEELVERGFVVKPSGDGGLDVRRGKAPARTL